MTWLWWSSRSRMAVATIASPNTVERAIKPQILTRKNALFAGSDGGVDHWACIASLLQTCKLNDVDPQAWLTDTLAPIAAGHKIGERRSVPLLAAGL